MNWKVRVVFEEEKKRLIDNDLYNFVYFYNFIENFLKFVLVFFFIVLSFY